MEVLVFAAVIGLIPAAIARSKGYSFITWWAFGALLFIVALPVAILMQPDAKATERKRLQEGMRKCPFCAELVKREAIVCRYCGREFKSDESNGCGPDKVSVSVEAADGASNFFRDDRSGTVLPAATRTANRIATAVCRSNVQRWLANTVALIVAYVILSAAGDTIATKIAGHIDGPLKFSRENMLRLIEEDREQSEARLRVKQRKTAALFENLRQYVGGIASRNEDAISVYPHASNDRYGDSNGIASPPP